MVIYVEDYWNTLMEVHDKQLFHAGYRKTFHKACHSSIVTVIEIISSDNNRIAVLIVTIVP